MTPAELRAARKRMGLTQAAFAARLGLTRAHVAKLEAGLHPIREVYARLVRQMLELSAP